MATSKKTTRKTKSGTVNRLLRRTKGATLVEIETATSWKPHSCRAFLSGVRKSGAILAKEARPNGQIAYRVTSEPQSCEA